MDVCYNKYTSKILFYHLLTSVFVTLLRSITNSRKLYPVILLTVRVVISGNRDGNDSPQEKANLLELTLFPRTSPDSGEKRTRLSEKSDLHRCPLRSHHHDERSKSYLLKHRPACNRHAASYDETTVKSLHLLFTASLAFDANGALRKQETPFLSLAYLSSQTSACTMLPLWDKVAMALKVPKRRDLPTHSEAIFVRISSVPPIRMRATSTPWRARGPRLGMATTRSPSGR